MKILRGLNNLWFAFCALLGICVLGQLITTFYISFASQDDTMLQFCNGGWWRVGWLLAVGGLFLSGMIIDEMARCWNEQGQTYVYAFCYAALAPLVFYVLGDFASFAPNLLSFNGRDYIFLSEGQLTKDLIDSGYSSKFYSWRRALDFKCRMIYREGEIMQTDFTFYWLRRALENVFVYLKITAGVAGLSALSNCLFPDSRYNPFKRLDRFKRSEKEVKFIIRWGIYILVIILIYNAFYIWSVVN